VTAAFWAVNSTPPTYCSVEHSWSAMSENGPREGTRDLPRPGPDSGRRAVTEDSPAGVAYGSISKSLRRRRAELVAMMEAGGTASTVARSYKAEHPLEPAVTEEEIFAALADAKIAVTKPESVTPDQRTRPVRHSKSSA
jgi:hypothetical protein